MIPTLIISLIREFFNKISRNSLSRKIQNNPDDYMLLLKMAESQMKKKDYTIALTYYIQVHTLKPANQIAIFYIGLLNLILKNFNESKIFFEQYLTNPIIKAKNDTEAEISDLLPEAYYYLGYANHKLNFIKEASDNKIIALSKSKRIKKLKLY